MLRKPTHTSLRSAALGALIAAASTLGTISIADPAQASAEGLLAGAGASIGHVVSSTSQAAQTSPGASAAAIPLTPNPASDSPSPAAPAPSLGSPAQPSTNAPTSLTAAITGAVQHSPVPAALTTVTTKLTSAPAKLQSDVGTATPLGGVAATVTAVTTKLTAAPAKLLSDVGTATPLGGVAATVTAVTTKLTAAPTTLLKTVGTATPLGGVTGAIAQTGEPQAPAGVEVPIVPAAALLAGRTVPAGAPDETSNGASHATASPGSGFPRGGAGSGPLATVARAGQTATAAFSPASASNSALRVSPVGGAQGETTTPPPPAVQVRAGHGPSELTTFALPAELSAPESPGLAGELSTPRPAASTGNTHASVPSAPAPLPPAPTGGFGFSLTGGASGGFGLMIFSLLGIAFALIPGAIRRLALASERWRPALFVLIPERPG